MREIERRELMQVVAIAAVVVATSSLPYLLGYLSAAPDAEFGGFVIDLDDSYSHLAKMQQGVWGGWKYRILFTPEEHQGAYLNTFYIALGKLSTFLRLSLIQTYQLARLTCGFALLITSYAFLSLFLGSREKRVVAYLLICFSSGCGWLVLLTGSPTLAGLSPIDFWLIDAYTFFSILTFPHFSAAMTLLAFIFILVLSYAETPRLRTLLVASLALLALVIIQPFTALLVDGVLAAYLALLFWHRKTPPWREGLAATIWVLTPIPLVAYYYRAFIGDPVFQSWSAQNLLPSPPGTHLLLGYGVLSLLAIGGFVHVIRNGSERALLLIAWAATALILAYLPFTLQRRMLEGVHVPLCVLATIGLFECFLPALLRSSWLARLARSRGYDPPGLRRLLLYCVVIVTFPSNLCLVGGSSLSVINRHPYLFYERAEVEAIAWLGNNTERSDTVLSSYEIGRFIPARAGNRVFMGHFIETVEVERKRELASVFYQADTSHDFRQDLLRQYGIRYLFLGPRERQIGGFDPSAVSYLTKAYANDQVTIYGVNP